MALTITATLVDHQGQPLARHEAQVCTFTAAGAPNIIGSALTDDAGKLSILSRWAPLADYQPRLQLRLRRGLGFVEASENPLTFVDGACDFGAVTFDPNLLKPRLLDAGTLAARVTTLEVENEALAQQHAQALAARDEQLHALGEQLAAATRELAPETSIEELASTAAEQLGRVRTALRAGQSGIQLGSVALQLKVLPGSDSGRLALPQTRQIERVGASALGSLDLAFLPEAAPAPAPRPARTAPSVLGYTEALARRKLAERKLDVEVAYRLVTSAGEHGRVLLQRPAPGAPVAEGGVVLIAIGRQDEHDPRPS